MEWISLLNYIAVSLFGCILSASFCGIRKGYRQRRWVVVTVIFMLIVEGVIYFFFGEKMVQCVYPLISHLSLFLVLWCLTKRGLCSLTAVLTAYLCCQLRRWAALFLTCFFEKSEMLLPIVQIVITVPFLIFLLRTTAPAIRRFIMRPAREMWTFMIVPLVYYLFDYSTVVYTNLLYEGSYLIAEFMPTVCCMVYLVFVNQTLVQENVRHQLEQERNALTMQAKQSLQDIEFLRCSQEQAAAHRHDLRHHMLYLASCIENGQKEQAKEYIQSVCQEIESYQTAAYCENETANLILTAYAGRFEKARIQTEIHFSLGKSAAVAPIDLCVLLANAMENALHECQYLLIQKVPVQVTIEGYEKEHKLFLQISNTCRADVSFLDGVPVARQEGHGIGTQSIRAIVNKYGGMYSFSVKNERFILRVVL